MSATLIPPSGANVWGRCSGSITMQPLYSRPKTQDQRDGDAAHYVAARMLLSCTSQGNPADFDEETHVGSADPAGTIITEEMYRAAVEYVNDVLQLANSEAGMDALMVEEMWVANRIHGECRGRIDACFYAAQTNTLYVWDFKFGHRDVPAYGDLQLAAYVASLLDFLQIDGDQDQRMKVVATIAKPRCFHGSGPIDRWEAPASDFRAYHNMLRNSAQEAYAGKGVLSPGPHCLGCAARHACPSLRKATSAMIEYLESPLPEDPDNETVALEKAMLDQAGDLLKARATGIDTEIESRIMGGQLVPGYRAKPRMGQTRWTVDADAVASLGQQYGVELVEEKPVTPAEAQRRAKRAGVEIDESVINAYTERPSSGVKIVKDDGSDAQKAFKG